MNEKRKVKVRKSDRLRALVTETSPAETPIIFSNDGLYIRAIKNQSTSSGLAEQVFDKVIRQEGQDLWHVPYSYKIKKSSLSHRQLSIPHPGSQWRMMEFYEKYSALITTYTSKSSSTLRAPKGVAASYFTRGQESEISRYKRSQVSLNELDKYLSHSPSFFSYRGHGRLYKFFDSNEFIDLEQKFKNLLMLDVAKCFDSIYTHTILWAVKSKSFAKDNFKPQSFGSKFDKLMQCANHGETSGIVIGPEISRIFAEIVLQEVDEKVKENLLNQGYKNGEDYELRRYVDDFFVFTNDTKTSSIVFAEIESELSKLKLNVNDSKIRRHERPFLTEKSKSILDAKALLSKFVRKFTKQSRGENRNLIATPIFKHDRLFLSFCNDVKTCCSANKCGYDEISAYLISAIKNRAVSLMDSYHQSPQHPLGSPEAADHEKNTYEALAVIIKCIFFLYSVAPSVNASYKLSMLIIIISRFSKSSLKDYSPALTAALITEATRTIELSSSESRTDGFVDLETQNILLAVSEFDAELSIPSKILETAFISENRPASYFNLVSAMYYIKSGPDYAVIRKWVCESVDSLLAESGDHTKHTEKLLTALDFIGCPHIEIQRRIAWATMLLDNLGLPTSGASAIDELVKDFETIPWFIDWKEIDLLNLLERKELRAVY
ncbi:antiviral reverse transcriptase Drt3b [Stenotrophomonas sp.]|uniref:antiviral reverse transcriptase Drt3b n=1 Tax=Stenotrophomonas sp. TaxID=69392 RepID=UPI0028AD4250|nr:antiviral reverse transcriptase Drt3b [Stenotrophomonas sp.]